MRRISVREVRPFVLRARLGVLHAGLGPQQGAKLASLRPYRGRPLCWPDFGSCVLRGDVVEVCLHLRPTISYSLPRAVSAGAAGFYSGVFTGGVQMSTVMKGVTGFDRSLARLLPILRSMAIGIQLPL